MKKALITGITGQDGAYLTELLLNKGYEVHGIKRRTSLFNSDRIDHLYKDPHEEKGRLELHYGDLTDTANITGIIHQVQPDEIYNLGAMSQVRTSFEIPEYTANVNAIGTLRILEAIKSLNLIDKIRFYQASSSELFGMVCEVPQKESTPFYPRSPYGISKLFAYWTTVNYREAYGLFACNGILFNHESPMRGENFVTRKITRAVSKIALGKKECVYLGNIDAQRDWGHAKDYVEAMYLMLQIDKPDDFVIATGKTTSIREFLRKAFKHVGVEIGFRGKGVDEIGFVVECTNDKFKIPIGQEVVKIDAKYFRPTEVEMVVGDASKAFKKLNWQPKCTLDDLIKDMMESDLLLYEKE